VLIKALNEYYDFLAKNNKVLPKGFSKADINYLICLSPNGNVDRIIDYTIDSEKIDKKGKVKTIKIPRSEMFPKQEQFSGIKANIVDYRALYIFGLNFDKVNGVFVSSDATDKAKKSHNDFIEKNIKFIEGLDSPIINAFREFLKNWNPLKETDNLVLNQIGKDYDKKYAFCLSGHPDILLHKDEILLNHWRNLNCNEEIQSNEHMGQCCITGEILPIARLHSKIMGVKGGKSTGMAIVSFNSDAETSYGKEQSYNSNVSELAMEKYTEVLNLLLKKSIILDDVTVVFWALNNEIEKENILDLLLNFNSETMDAEETRKMIADLLKDAKSGNITHSRLNSKFNIDSNVMFYILGIKPNAARISVKFLYKQAFGKILNNIAMHQQDLQISEDIKPIALYEITRELVSPKSSTDKVSPALISKIFESILYGTRYPEYLLSTLVRRVKTDSDIKPTGFRFANRAAIIKACINRNDRKSGKKEDLQVSLDKENCNEGYLCGRLFATLEQLQRNSSKSELNRTIRDSYFASACSKPVIVFPKLLVLSQNHIKKVNSNAEVFFSKEIGEIIDKLGDSFPNTLGLKEQGKFIIGYYQQRQSFFKKQEKVVEE